jgi:beta-galactosidase
VLFGAAYYHEYQPHQYQPDDRLGLDLDLMAEARFSVIRVGESVWSTWEPENGRFDLDWLQPVLDGAHARGIAVLLGTPTYAVPPWLARLYPEITGERKTGQRIGWGARQEVDFTHPGFRFHAERVIRKIVARYADHPAVIGFQVDNEPGNELLHNHGVFQRFVDSLRHKYGDVQKLNDEWGLVYWSHRLSDWADLWTPDGNVQPQYDVAWRQFQAEQTTDFIGWQADIVREYARPDQLVTTCIAYDRPAVADDELVRRLDVTAGNPYYAMQDGLQHPQTQSTPQGWTTSGTWALYLSADRMYSSKQSPFLVTETNAQAIGAPWTNHPAYDGQWRQAAWALVSRGAKMIEYWHWHTLHFGTETYWGGVLPHSGQPGRMYREVTQLGAEFEAAGSLVVDLTPDSDVTMLYSTPSKWLMQKYPALAHADGSPDERSYHGFFDAFYRGAFDAGLQVRILHTSQFTGSVQDAPVLVVPALYLADTEFLDQLVAYAEAGGHLVVGPRTGYADQEARARTDVQPARLAAAAGVWYDEFSNVSVDVPVRGVGLDLGTGAAASRWIDGLIVDGADVLVGYDHPHYGRWPAITSRAHGAGRITYVGTVPNPALSAALFRWIKPAAWTELPPGVTVTSATSADGRRIRFVHNWSWDSVDLKLPGPADDVLANQPTNGKLDLGPWDVRVLVEPDQ